MLWGLAVVAFLVMGFLVIVALFAFCVPIIQEECKRRFIFDKMPEKIEDGHCDEMGFALSAIVALITIPALIVLYIYVIKPFLL